MSVDYALVRLLQAQVADEMTRLRQARWAAGRPELSGDDERQMTLAVVGQVVADHMADQISAGHTLPGTDVDEQLITALDAAIYGAGELQELLDDPDIENIDINGCDEVWITYADARGKVRGRPIAGTDEDLVAIVQSLASFAGLNARPFTRATPELDLRLPDGSRLSAVMAAAERPFVSVRRNRFPQMFLHTLVGVGSVDEQLAAFLGAAVRARMNVMVAGATDAGKTTLLRALINCIEPDERLIVVERALELGLRRHPELHPDVVELEEVLADADGQGGLSIGQLVRRTRRHNPSRVIVGEVLGPEVVEMLSAMSQGNNGSLSTIHARSAQDVFGKLATYGAQYEHLPFEVTYALIAASIDYIVYIEKSPVADGKRMVAEVVEVSHFADGQVARSRPWVRDPVSGRAIRAGEVPLIRRDALETAGYSDGVWP